MKEKTSLSSRAIITRTLQSWKNDDFEILIATACLENQVVDCERSKRISSQNGGRHSAITSLKVSGMSTREPREIRCVVARVCDKHASSFFARETNSRGSAGNFPAKTRTSTLAQITYSIIAAAGQCRDDSARQGEVRAPHRRNLRAFRGERTTIIPACVSPSF